MQAYFEAEQAFCISMPQPVFEISIAHKKKTCITTTFTTFAISDYLTDATYLYLLKEKVSCKGSISSYTSSDLHRKLLIQQN